jgi:predicted DNA-binding transcriptional regulator AlpA
MSVLTPEGRLLDVHDLGERLGIPVGTIYRKRSAGEPMPAAVRVGRALRWKPETVAAWIDAQEEPTGV